MKTIDELFDWADLTTDCQKRTLPLTQRGGDVFLVLHHAYNLKVQDTIALSKPGGREVSMSGAMGATEAGSQVIKAVKVVDWNAWRPYTTASSIDDKAITFEVSNLSLAPPYPVAQAAKQRLAEFAAAMHVQLGMPLDAWHILDHSTVYERGWGSYPTACCGQDLRDDIPWIIAEAQRIVAAESGGTPDPEEDDMSKSNSGFVYNRASDKKDIVLILNTDSGWYVEYVNTQAIVGGTNDAIAATMGIGEFARISEALANAFKVSLPRAQGVDLNDADVKALANALAGAA